MEQPVFGFLSRPKRHLSSSPKRTILFGSIFLVAFLLLYSLRIPIERQPGLFRSERTLVVSGNIEAHECVLGFKAIHSRIIELPFDEGQSAKAGTLIARVEDADYRREVTIAKTSLAVQERQLAATKDLQGIARIHYSVRC